MIKEKLFTLNRFTRKFVIWLYSKRENGEWRSKTLRELFKKYRNINAGYASYGWAREGIDGPLTIGRYTSIGGNVRRISVNHPSKELQLILVGSIQYSIGLKRISEVELI